MQWSKLPIYGIKVAEKIFEKIPINGKMIGISNSYQSDINVIAHAMGNVIGLLLKDTQE